MTSMPQPEAASPQAQSEVQQEGGGAVGGAQFDSDNAEMGETYLGKRPISSLDSILSRQLGQQPPPEVPHRFQQKKKSVLEAFDQEFGNEFEEGDSIEALMKRVEKNPIALLNEFCTRIKSKIDYIINVKKITRRQIFYCQVAIGGQRIGDKYQEGESKQEAKTLAALDAIRILEGEPHYRNDMLCLLQRLEKKVNYQEDVKPKYQPSKISSIKEILEDEANILSILNTYAQNSKESLKWRIKNEDNICLAEINIGTLVSSASKNNKRQAKISAAKNLLKMIDSATFLKEKFFYYLRDAPNLNKDKPSQHESSYLSRNFQVFDDEDEEHFVSQNPRIQLPAQEVLASGDARALKETEEVVGAPGEPNLLSQVSFSRPGQVTRSYQGTTSFGGQQIEARENLAGEGEIGQLEPTLASEMQRQLLKVNLTLEQINAVKADEIETLDEFDDDESMDVKKWFDDYNKCIKASDLQMEESQKMFSQISEILSSLVSGGGIKLIPIGSYLLGCMRKDKMEIDCLLIDVLSPESEVNLLKVKDAFIERKSSFNLMNNYAIYEAQHSDKETYSCLTFSNSVNGIKIKIIAYKDYKQRYINPKKKSISYFTASLFHTVWLEQQVFSKEAISNEACNFLRIIREWRDKNCLDFPSEILDLALVYSTYNFKELDTVRVLLKFFALINLLINDYNYYFYELSEYHGYIIQNLPTKSKIDIIKKAQETFVHLSSGNNVLFE